MDVTPKSLILDLLVTLRDGSMPVRSLVAAGDLFGLPENGIRVALARLTAAGQIERDERGQYRLGARAAAVRGQVDSWRTLERRTVPWDGTWLGVVPAGAAAQSRRPQQRLDERALRFFSFQRLGRGLAVRPNNLRGGIAAVRAQLIALGLTETTIVCVLSAFDARTEARARALWDAATLDAGYRASLAEIARSEARLARGPVAAAMIESFLVGGRVIRRLVLDPLLPHDIAPARARQALLEAMRRYDRLGRTCWAGFLGQFGVPHRQTPLDTRVATQRETVASAGGGAT